MPQTDSGIFLNLTITVITVFFVLFFLYRDTILWINLTGKVYEILKKIKEKI